MPQARRIRCPVQFTGRIWREGEKLVSYCDQLEAATSGSTYQEVQDRMLELIEIHFEEAARTGTLAELLLRCGVTEPVERPQELEATLAFLVTQHAHVSIEP